VSCRRQVRATSGAVAALVLQGVRTFRGRCAAGRGDEASRPSTGSALRPAGAGALGPVAAPVHPARLRQVGTRRPRARGRRRPLGLM